ncbi:MAG: hypothetical protein IIW40_04670 [Clostridia bacterium]|nr:hypothetical protein [Clostridia bacterium]
MNAKKLLALLLTIVLLLTPLSACRKKPVSKPDNTSKPDSSVSEPDSVVDEEIPDEESSDPSVDDSDVMEDWGDDYADYDETMPTITKGSPSLDYLGKTVGVLVPDRKPAYYDALLKTIKSGVNATIKEIAWKDAKNALTVMDPEAVIIPDSQTVPYGTSTAVTNYLKRGGKLLSLGDLPMSETVYYKDGKWLDGQTFMTTDSQGKGRYILSDFDRDKDLTKIVRNNSTIDGDCILTLGDFGSPTGTKALHMNLKDARGWDSQGFKSVGIGYQSIGLWAKGDKNTPEMSVEVREADGSRWFAVLQLTEKWQYYVLGPNDFTYWQWSSTNTTERGGANDRVNIKDTIGVSFGISFSYCKNSEFGEKNIYVDSVNLLNYAKPEEDNLILEGFSGDYKYYPVTNGNKLVTYDNQMFVADRKYTLPKSMVSMHAGTQGVGFGQKRGTRFVPLIEIMDGKNLSSGYLAWMNINSSYAIERETNSSMTACFSTSDPAFYDKNGLAAVLDVLRTMLNDSLFVEAGTSEIIYVKSETDIVNFGAYVRAEDMSTVTMDLDLAKGGKRIAHTMYDYAMANEVTNKDGVSVSVESGRWALSAGEPDQIVMTLKQNDVVVDRIVQDVILWEPEAMGDRSYITKKDGEFWQNGKPLRLYGINYVPNMGTGLDDYTDNSWDFEVWNNPNSYNPERYYRDLLRLKEIGFNAIAINCYPESAEAGKNIMHFIYMCQKLGIYVDAFVYGADGVTNGSGGGAVTIIETQHLAEFDNIVAYDLCWERTFGTYNGDYNNPNGRKQYDDEWHAWILRNYGSIANAEKAWGEVVPKSGVNAIGPTDAMVAAEDASKMVAAYRRFADELIAERYYTIISTLKRVDPYHMMSSRAGAPSGWPMYNAANMVFDAQGLASAYDFYSPEYYATVDTIEDAIFVNYYARYCMPESPVVWKEFGIGLKCFDNYAANFLTEANKTRKQELENQANYAKTMLEAIIAGHGTAAYGWLFNGGIRVGSWEDYGATNPDGSDRPITKVYREYRDKFMNQPLLSDKADVVFTVDRDRTANGWMGMYTAIKDVLLKAVKEGKTVAFVDEGTGKNTATVSDASVGNAGAASDTNPARYVNGEIKDVYVRGSDGVWKKVNYADTVQIPKGPVDVKIVATNTQRAEWLSKSSSSKNYVSIVSKANSQIKVNQPLSKNVKYLETITQEFRLTNSFNSWQSVSFRFGIEGRFAFGETFTFNMSVQD